MSTAIKKEKSTGYVQPPMPKSGYSFVQAGNLFSSFAGWTIYVKYKGSLNKHSIKIKDYTKSYIWLICPDREIIIVNNSYEHDAFYPYGESFDACFDINCYNDYVLSTLGIEYAMTNYAHTSPKYNTPRLRNRITEDRKIQMLSDSGGLQLITGVKKFINPVELMNFYNNNTDAGMTLDIPLRFSDPVIVKKVAAMQRRCNDIMLAHSKGPELINIFHGFTQEERAIYRDIVEDERIPRVAFGALGKNSHVAGVNTIMKVTEEGKIKYKQHHVLGIYSSGYIPVLVKLANSGSCPHVTSDSTSHIQSASNKAYHFQFDMYHNMKRVSIGSRATIPNTQRFLPCQCPICKALKYADILGFLPNNVSMELLAIHNSVEMARYAKSLQEVALQATPQEYNKLVAQQIKHNSELADVKMALDFIDVTAATGLKSARKKYVNHLQSSRSTKFNQESLKGSLFGGLEEQHDDKYRALTNTVLKAMRKCVSEITLDGE